MRRYSSAEVGAGVLGAAVGVKYEAGLARRRPSHFDEGLLDQVVVHAIRQNVAGHLARLQTDHGGKVLPRFTRCQIRDVAYPSRYITVHRKPSIKQILSRQRGVSSRCITGRCQPWEGGRLYPPEPSHSPPQMPNQRPSPASPCSSPTETDPSQHPHDRWQRSPHWLHQTPLAPHSMPFIRNPPNRPRRMRAPRPTACDRARPIASHRRRCQPTPPDQQK